MLVQGRVNVKDNRWYYLGPNPKGEFTQVKVKSIHRHRIPVNYVHCGQTAALALSEINTHDWKTHRGMVLLETTEPVSFLEFEAEIMVLYHETGVYTGTRGMIHSGSIQQHAQVISIEPKSIKPISDDIMENATSTLTDNNTIISSGFRGKCVFRFVHEPCYLRIGSRVLFMKGTSKCLGRITRFVNFKE